MCLGHTGGNGADTDLGNELDTDARVTAAVLQIVNQFREVFDGINVMMRRWRNQSDARRGVPCLGNLGENLAPRQFAAFTRLGALSHLDLQFLGVDEVIARHTKPAGRDLFDGAVLGIAVGHRHVTFRIFAAFAGVALAPEPVHGDGQRFVRLLADRAVAHRARLEPLYQALNRLHFLDGDRIPGPLEVKQTAKGTKVLGLVVDQFGVFLKHLVASQPAGNLQFVDRLRIEQVKFTVAAPLVLAAGIKRRPVDLALRKSVAMPLQHFIRNNIQANALDARCGARKIAIDQ